MRPTAPAHSGMPGRKCIPAPSRNPAHRPVASQELREFLHAVSTALALPKHPQNRCQPRRDTTEDVQGVQRVS